MRLPITNSGEYDIKAGSTVWLCPYTTHRHPAFWEQLEVFDPLRFTPNMGPHAPTMRTSPFGGEPRLCTGRVFAVIEAHLILARVAQRYRLCLERKCGLSPNH